MILPYVVMINYLRVIHTILMAHYYVIVWMLGPTFVVNLVVYNGPHQKKTGKIL